MRPFDLDQALTACREAADLIATADDHPGADLSPAERRELTAIANAITAFLNQKAPRDCRASPTTALEILP